MESYSALADLYEKLIKDCDYENWSQYLLNKITSLTSGKKGLDLACGSGLITRYFARNGFIMTGGDISEQMLAKAKSLSIKEKLNIDYYLADLINLYVKDKFDFVTVINDGINYIKPQNLKKVFKGISKQLKSGGILIFDISSEYKLKNILGNNLFGEDDQNYSYLWFNTLYENRVEMDLSFFIKQKDVYVKKEEKHVQYIHLQQDILLKAQENGFEVLEVQPSQEENPNRINFIMRKK